MVFSLNKILSGFKSSDKNLPSSTVGIDFGSSSVKVTELVLSDGKLVLKTYGELQLGPYGSTDLGEVVKLDPAKQIEALVDVMREARVESQHGALAMPLTSSFITVMPITLGSDEDLSSRIPVEAKKYVPLPLSEVMLDWNELPTPPNLETSVKEVLVAAIENKALANYNNLLGAVSMTGEPAEIESFSLIRSAVKRTDQVVAVMDFGASTSKLYMVRDGVLERLHRVMGGGTSITHRLMSLLQINFAEAESLKRNYTADVKEARDIYNSTVSVVERSAQEFKRLISVYESRNQVRVEKVVIAGGVSASPILVSYLKDLLSREVVVADPFAKVAYPAFMEDTLKSIGPVFATSLGAALRRFDVI